MLYSFCYNPRHEHVFHSPLNHVKVTYNLQYVNALSFFLQNNGAVQSSVMPSVLKRAMNGMMVQFPSKSQEIKMDPIDLSSQSGVFYGINNAADYIILPVSGNQHSCVKSS